MLPLQQHLLLLLHSLHCTIVSVLVSTSFSLLPRHHHCTASCVCVCVFLGMIAGVADIVVSNRLCRTMTAISVFVEIVHQLPLSSWALGWCMWQARRLQREQPSTSCQCQGPTSLDSQSPGVGKGSEACEVVDKKEHCGSNGVHSGCALTMYDLSVSMTSSSVAPFGIRCGQSCTHTRVGECVCVWEGRTPPHDCCNV